MPVDMVKYVNEKINSSNLEQLKKLREDYKNKLLSAPIKPEDDYTFYGAYGVIHEDIVDFLSKINNKIKEKIEEEKTNGGKKSKPKTKKFKYIKFTRTK